MDPINPIAGNPEALNSAELRVKEQSLSRLSNITIFSMAAFVLLSLGIVAFLYYQNQQLKGMLAKYQTPISSPTPIATTDPTANWKTYTDPKGVYSFKYPNDWKLTLNQINSGQVVLLDKIDTTQPKVGLQDGSIKDASYEINFSFPANKVVIPSNAEKYIVSGIAGSKYSEGCGGCSGASTFVVVKNNNLTYSFSYGAQANLDTHTKYLTTFDQILSTFKFLGQNNSDIDQVKQFITNFLKSTGLTQVTITEIKLLGNYTDKYVVSYNTGGPSGSFVLVGKINNQWAIPKDNLMSCDWIKNSGTDDATKAYMGPSCGF